MAATDSTQLWMKVEIAPGVFRTEGESIIFIEGKRRAMEESGVVPSDWLPPASMKRPRRMFAHQGVKGEATESRGASGYGWVRIVLSKPGCSHAQSGWHLNRAARGDKQLQRFLRDAARLRLVESEKD